ncbi:MAG: acetoacetate--CoA ligase, partial [Gammaproteobacteria bacterium]|nr:acetoacetate--CoA ligase [Gammaproteobacteria bacterium]
MNTISTESKPLWQPSPEQINATYITEFIMVVNQQYNLQLSDYQSLWQWTIDHPEAFWSLLWDYCDVVGEKGDRILEHAECMPGADWFPDAELNYAENLLLRDDDSDSLVFWGEDIIKRRLTHRQLRSRVSQCQQALRRAGVVKGDRVAGYLPNMPETIIAMLATTSLGGIWCSASPDFGVEGVLDRFGQIQPKVLFCVDGYFYNGKWIDCLEKNRAVLQRLGNETQAVLLAFRDEEQPGCAMDQAVAWRDFIAPYEAAELIFVRVAFGDPLYIMFSSGTTGAPKCIVHSVGGTLIQHLKEHRLHANIRPDDRLFYFTTCGWMMWNWLVTGLASEATLLLYDGSPFAGNKQLLFDFAEQEGMTQLGTSAKYIEACNKHALQPIKTRRLEKLRSVFSTGSPLTPESFRYVYSNIKKDLHLASISGGTDILSCFALGAPILPVWVGELQCLGLGMAVDAFDQHGQPVRGGKGDLVCTKPFPAMPIGFWDDEDGSRYRSAYFERFPNVWCHGDFVEITPHNGMIIHGRSDAVLNPGGVRIGTAEIYRQVEKIDQVLESVVIGQEWQDDVRVV